MKKYIKPAIQALSINLENTILEASLGVYGTSVGIGSAKIGRRPTILDDDEEEDW